MTGHPTRIRSAETYLSFREPPISVSGYVANAVGIGITLWATVAMRKGRAYADGLMAAGWAWTIAVFWRATTLRGHVMRLRLALVALLASAPVAAQSNLGTYDDRIAVEDVMARYVWAVDSLDADGYVAVFTPDAVIDSNGAISKGHAEIRKIVTGLIQRRDGNKAKGLPAANLYHVISSPRITFPKPGEALHQSYWQTVRRDENGRMIAAAMGRSEDHLVKRKGEWRIRFRKLTVFTD